MEASYEGGQGPERGCSAIDGRIDGGPEGGARSPVMLYKFLSFSIVMLLVNCVN